MITHEAFIEIVEARVVAYLSQTVVEHIQVCRLVRQQQEEDEAAREVADVQRVDRK